MAGISKEELLRVPQVVEEIKRHLWIESEQAGYDIGFDNAADDWIKKYSTDWLKYYMPEKLETSKIVTNTTAKIEPAKPQTWKPEPVKQEAVKVEMIKKEAPKAEAVKKEAVKVEPVVKKPAKRSAKSYKK